MKLQALANMLKNMIENRTDIADMEVYVEDADFAKRILNLGLSEFGFVKNYRFQKESEKGDDQMAICIGFLERQTCPNCGRH